MGGDDRFWIFFGGIWLVVGVLFLSASVGTWLFADPESLNPSMPLWPFGAVGLAGAGAGAAVLRWTLAAAARARRLIETGIEIDATVSGVRRSAIRINRETRWHVAYRYEYPARHPREGESRALTEPDAEEFRPGDRVRIKVDPRDPDDSLFLGRT